MTPKILPRTTFSLFSFLSLTAAPPARATPPPAPMTSFAGKAWLDAGEGVKTVRVTWKDGRITAVTPQKNAASPSFAVPGLVDAHAHLVGLGLSLRQLDLRGVESRDALKQRLADYAKAHPADAWILGRGWDQNLWPDAKYPTKADLDAAAGKRPVVLERVDGHAVVASSEALRLSVISAKTTDPAGGRILRDAGGEPTGVLIDAATQLVRQKVPPPSEPVLEEAILAAQAHVFARGLTGVHEMGIDPREEAVYRKLAREKRLKLRVVAMMARSPEALKRLESPRPQSAPDDRFVLAGIKLYADGALGSRGAALLKPYADEPSTQGLLITPAEEIERAAVLARKNGWQVAVHAIGDRGVRAVLDAFERASKQVPTAKAGLLRVEHAQIIDPADIPRFAKLGVIASMQPTHATSDMGWAGVRLGEARLAGAYAWRSLLKASAQLCGGSDFPVELADPRLGLYAALTRQTLAGEPPGGWRPEERLTMNEALRLFTEDNAACAERAGDVGRIRPAMAADFTIFDRDISAGAAAIKDAKVVATVVGGEVVYSRTTPD